MLDDVADVASARGVPTSTLMRQWIVERLVLSAGLFDNALASLGEDGSAALSEDARRRRPVGMVTSDRRRGDARLFSCV